MERELEVAGAASIGGWLRRRKPHLAAVGSPCANCGSTLQGPYCHECGQLAENFHRSLWHLLVEAVESFFHFDGRFWKTLPRLVRDPGGLTRDYLEGRRAWQIPPLRLFLVVLLLVFFLGGLGQNLRFAAAVRDKSDGHMRIVPLKPGVSERDIAGNVKVDVGDVRKSAALKSWITKRLLAAANSPEQFAGAMETWAHRLAVLLLPIGAGLLAVLFAFPRRYFFYDHLIFTMHSLSFQGLLLCVFFLTPSVVWPVGVVLVVAGAPTHLFVHMRGTYRTSVMGTLSRMAALFVGSAFAFLILLGVLVWIGFSAVGKA